VEIAGAADRADFAVTKESGAWNRAEDFGKDRSVVIWRAEESLTATVAGKDERSKGLAALQAINRGQLDKIIVSRTFVAELVLKSLSGTCARTNRDRAGLRIGA
jgi:hypothetical protein